MVGTHGIRVCLGLIPKQSKVFNNLKHLGTLIYFKNQATLFHYGCGMVKQELLYLKVPSVAFQ